jgi:hypothetical protein
VKLVDVVVARHEISYSHPSLADEQAKEAAVFLLGFIFFPGSVCLHGLN